MFEKASRQKLRFNFKGNITAEDLWDLSVNELDTIYKSLSKIKKDSNEDSLLQSTKSSTLNDLRMDIVKHVFAIKMEEKENREKKAERLVKKRRLQSILAEKQDQDLKGKSVEELSKLIDELED